MARSAPELLRAARGRALGAIALTSVGATILAFTEGGIEILQAGVSVPVNLLRGVAQAIGEVVVTVIVTPLGLIEAGARISATELQQFGVLAFIGGIGLFYIGLQAFTTIRNEEETSDFLPGTFFDIGRIPIIGAIFAAEEEADAED